MMRLGSYNVGIECGQSLWRPRSWRGPGKVRRLTAGGFAVGPIMVWRSA